MDLLSIIVVAFGLSMDAFAAAIGKGLDMKKIDIKWSLIVAVFFGTFQALMPILGWLLGGQFNKYINEFDHWVAFILLLIIGGKMILDSRSNCEKVDNKNNFGELIIISIATSVDALAVGITFALLEIDIILSSLIIGIITFGLSFLGVILGNKFGCQYKSKAELFGGIILIVIGLKILLEHLNFL